MRKFLIIAAWCASFSAYATHHIQAKVDGKYNPIQLHPEDKIILQPKMKPQYKDVFAHLVGDGITAIGDTGFHITFDFSGPTQKRQARSFRSLHRT